MSGFTRDVVSTPNAPKAIGPYSQAIKANGFVFISGQVPIDPATGNLIEGGIEAQTEQVLNLVRRLADQGVTMLIVTHEMDAFADVVTRVVVVDRGGVAFDGSRDAFRRGRPTVLHDHLTHHHDDEPDDRPGRRTGARTITGGVHHD